jgi:SAM-dependent methyltransferase/NAD(P)-dependent dehydrogenase (short-subunit alcohol dehydrogenase family)/acyl carrier protein
VALRDGARYVEAYEQTPIDAVGVPVAMPPQPVVFVTGGLGHIGLNLAEQMFARLHARVVLLGRGALPEPAQWAERAEDTNLPRERRALLGRLARMRDERDEILVVNADLNRPEQLKAAVAMAVARFGAIDVVVHGAGRVDAEAFASVAETGPAVVEAHLSPKLRGMLYLIEAMKDPHPRRWILHGSISSVLGGLGLGAYAGANAVLDAYAVAGGEGWLSIGWDAWDNALESALEGMPTPIYPIEGAEAFLRLLGTEIGHRGLVVVNDLNDRLRDWVRRGEGSTQSKHAGATRHPRPNLSTPFVEPNTDTERRLAEIWAEQLGLEAVGVHDRFLDLGGHSLLAVQVCSEIRDTFQVELPVLRLFQAPTVGQLAEIVDQSKGATLVGAAKSASPGQPAAEASRIDTPAEAARETDDNTPGALAKAGFREFYNGITRRLEESGVGDASFFLNYGYVGLGGDDDAQYDVAEGLLNASSIRLVYELLGKTKLRGKRVLDVGSGRGGTAALLAEQFGAKATGVDLAPEAVAFCRRIHRSPNVRFEVGDAEQLPCKDKSFDVVTNVESSHTYPNLRGFFVEVRRVLKPGGLFLYTDLLPVQRWAEVRVLLTSLRFELLDDRHITANVLASCDLVAATRAKAFGAADAGIDNFLAVPGSTVYEQMRSEAWQYRIVRCRAAALPKPKA